MHADRKPARRYWSGVKGQGEGLRFILDNLSYDGDGCLPWPLSCDDKGYAIVSIDGKVRKAHRVMCEMVKGPPPSPRHQAAHECGNGHQSCIHPMHLDWKTNSQNQLDRRRHGRQTGQPYGRRGKLTPDQIKVIQAERGVTTIVTLAARYGVKRGAIDYWHKKARDAVHVVENCHPIPPEEQ